MNWYLAVLKKYAVFSGRARRKEYWMFQLFNALIILAYGLVVAVIGPSVIAAADTAAKATAVAGDAEKAAEIASATAHLVLVIPFFLYWLAIFLPKLAVSVRRLHDTGRSGWWYLINFVPLVGEIIFFIFTVFGSQPRANKYGPKPKA